jgi:tetratricopeptide (TPR) repeat protein
LAHALFERAWSTKEAKVSLPIWQRAGAIYDSLLAEQPDDPNRMRNVALVEKYMGSQLERIDRKASVPHYQRALALDERRLARSPEDPQVRLDTAIDVSNLAVGFEAEHDYEAAIALRARSTEMRRALAEADPRNVMVRGRLGRSLQAQARTEALAGRADAAFPHVREALDIARATLKDAPDAVDRAELADTLSALGLVEERRGRRDASCRAYREAMIAYTATTASYVPHRGATEAALVRCAGH